MLNFKQHKILFFGFLFYVLCPPSCIYIGVKGKISSDTQHKSSCINDSEVENKKCREVRKRLNSAIEKHKEK